MNIDNPNELKFHALCSLIAEATFDPFDIGPCYVTGPIEMVKRGEKLQVEERRMEGVFGQLWDRLKDRLPDEMKAEQRRSDELAELRAYRDRNEAALAKVREQVEMSGGVSRYELHRFGLWREPPKDGG